MSGNPLLGFHRLSSDSDKFSASDTVSDNSRHPDFPTVGAKSDREIAPIFPTCRKKSPTSDQHARASHIGTSILLNFPSLSHIPVSFHTGVCHVKWRSSIKRVSPFLSSFLLSVLLMLVKASCLLSQVQHAGFPAFACHVPVRVGKSNSWLV